MRRMHNLSLVSRSATLAGCVLLIGATLALVPQPASLTLAAAFALLSLLSIYDRAGSGNLDSGLSGVSA